MFLHWALAADADAAAVCGPLISILMKVGLIQVALNLYLYLQRWFDLVCLIFLSFFLSSVVLQKINLQQQQQPQPESEVDVWKKNKKICALCKKAAAPVLKFLSNPSNQEKIKSVLDHVCNILPGELKKKVFGHKLQNFLSIIDVLNA